MEQDAFAQLVQHAVQFRPVERFWLISPGTITRDKVFYAMLYHPA